MFFIFKYSTKYFKLKLMETENETENGQYN